jgi:hypothetical protein
MRVVTRLRCRIVVSLRLFFLAAVAHGCYLANTSHTLSELSSDAVCFLTTNSANTNFKGKKIRKSTNYIATWPTQMYCPCRHDLSAIYCNAAVFTLPKSFVSLTRMSYLALDLENDDSLSALLEMRSQHASTAIDV